MRPPRNLCRLSYRSFLPCTELPWWLLAACLISSGCYIRDHEPKASVSDAATSATDLLHTLDDRRWVEPRLSRGRAHQSCRDVCLSSQLLCEPVCPGENGSAHNLGEAVSKWTEEDNDPLETHARAILLLATQHELPGLERAVEMLELLVNQHPADAYFLSDLAAGYIVLGQRKEEPLHLAKAMVAAERSLKLDASLAEGRFNRALASSRLSLFADALTAWDSYIELDPDSPWAAEARVWQRRAVNVPDAAEEWKEARDRLAAAAERRNADLVLELVEVAPTAARLWLQDTVLPEWGSAHLEGDENSARRSLTTARIVAEVLTERRADRLLLDAVQAIERAKGQRLRLLADGHRAYGEATLSYRAFDLTAAGRSYRLASDLLGAGDSPFRAWAVIGSAVLEYQEHDLPAALGLLIPLRKQAERLGYNSLAGRTAWIIGLCQIYSNLPTEALESYKIALERYRALGESESVGNLHARLAELYYWILGDPESAWRHRLQALSALPSIVDPRRKLFVIGEAASALEADLPRAARDLQREALRIARRFPEDPGNLAIALRTYGETRLDEDPEKASAHLEEAFQISWQVPDSKVRKSIQGRLREVEGRLWAGVDPSRAIASYTAALELLPLDELFVYRAQLYLERALIHLSSDRRAAAEVDLRASVREIEKEWQQVLNRRQPGEHESLWAAYFGSWQQTFDLMIRLQVEMGNSDEALAYAEKARAREILDLIDHRLSSQPSSNGTFVPLTADEIRHSLPAGTVLVEYALLDDQLLTWTFRRGESTGFDAQPIERSLVDRAVAKIQRAAAGRNPDLDPEALHWLHSILVKPILEIVRAGDRLVFVPEDSIHGVPFAALRDDSSDRFLIQDHAIAIAPSATLMLYAERRSREMPHQPKPRVLLVGDPAFTPGLYPGLRQLDGARIETKEVAELYLHTDHLQGRDATVTRFLSLLGRADIVHFAGHAVSVPNDPSKSMLVLAPDGSSDSGALYASDLLRHESLRARIVVLSACSTAGGHAIGALGVSSLVRPIIGAGVPAVVGSLWDVSDLATRQLLIELHRSYSTGADAATALQEAQIALLEKKNRALSEEFSWAPFQVIGTSSLMTSNKKEH